MPQWRESWWRWSYRSGRGSIPIASSTRPKSVWSASNKWSCRRSSLISDREQLDIVDSIHTRAGEALPAGLVLEHFLHPIQVWLILPLFALANAGVAIGGDLMAVLVDPLALGIIVGLVVGKPVGISLLSWLAVKSGRGALPAGVTWVQVAGAGCLAGIGFTMSLFVTDLAFNDEALIATAKIGILAASLTSGIVGYVLLARSLPKALVDRSS